MLRIHKPLALFGYLNLIDPDKLYDNSARKTFIQYRNDMENNENPLIPSYASIQLSMNPQL